MQRTCIVAPFLFCAGAGQVLALRRAPQAPLGERFWSRWAQVAGCALPVSSVSYVMFPRAFISFCVLYAVGAMWWGVAAVAWALRHWPQPGCRRRWPPSAAGR